jgi:probable F420-dependent oxidoreductase
VDYGLFGFNDGGLCSPDSMERVVVSAEQLGYESVWTGEHVIMIDPQEPPSPVPPESPMMDTVASLAFAAAKTERIKLGSGVLLLPQRDPIVLAKELAGVDVLSKGRLLFGLGVGYVQGEFEALGIPYEERGPRTTEHIEVLRTLWTQEKPVFDGRFTKFSGIQSHPMPIQKPHPPILVGGHSPPALRRAVAQGDGWYGCVGLEETKEKLSELEEVAKRVERPESLGRLEITITPPGRDGYGDGFIDADQARRFEDLGVDRLVLVRDWIDQGSPPSKEIEDGVVRFLEEEAEELGLV